MPITANFINVLSICVVLFSTLVSSCEKGEDSGGADAGTNTSPVINKAETNSRPDTALRDDSESDALVHTVINPRGWIHVDLINSESKQSRRSINREDGVFFAKVAPRNKMLLPLSCSGLEVTPAVAERCNAYPFGIDWRVREITVFDKMGRVFAYNVEASRSKDGQSGGIQLLAFYDEDGDGVFESFDLSNSLTSFHVPSWVKKIR